RLSGTAQQHGRHYIDHTPANAPARTSRHISPRFPLRTLRSVHPYRRASGLKVSSRRIFGCGVLEGARSPKKHGHDRTDGVYNHGVNVLRRTQSEVPMRVVRLVALLAFVVLLPSSVLAQASLTGVVKDASGAVLPGATVEA